MEGLQGNGMRLMVLVLFSAVMWCLSVSAGQSATNHVFDCGVNAVYLVQRLKGMDADLREISERLGRDAEKGSSIHDIETYLHSVGIQTDARLMRVSGLCKMRGALAILLMQGEDGAGHFIVARVLDGGQLQIIDSLTGTRIEEDAPESKKSLPVILIDPPGQAWTWKLFALASVSFAVCWGSDCFFRANTER
ncbi:MAG: hypothetical protein EOM62_14770 [Bacteroidia bacterium]|nr:hypothetical protein [Bacteroidia bacterium]